MSVQFPDVGVVFYLGMLAHFALPDTRPSRASNLGSMPKDRFWAIVRLHDRPLRDCHLRTQPSHHPPRPTPFTVLE